VWHVKELSLLKDILKCLAAALSPVMVTTAGELKNAQMATKQKPTKQTNKQKKP
jgi:hypothetical protein